MNYYIVKQDRSLRCFTEVISPFSSRMEATAYLTEHAITETHMVVSSDEL